MTTPTPAAAGGAKGGGSERDANEDTKRLRELADEATARGGLCAISPSTILRLLDERDALAAANEAMRGALKPFVQHFTYINLPALTQAKENAERVLNDPGPPPAPLAGDGEAVAATT